MSTRQDGRKANELRSMISFFDGLARVDGSARFGFGPYAQALASVTGPIEVRLAAENATQTTLEVYVRPLSNVPSTESKAFASAITAAITPSLILTQNPRSLVQVVLQAMVTTPRNRWKDSLLASMINATTLAFLNAGSIPMRGTVAAVFIGRSRTSGDKPLYLVDPVGQELESLDAGGCFAFIFSSTIPNGSTCVFSNWVSTSYAGSSSKEFLHVSQLAEQAALVVWNEMNRVCGNVTSLDQEGKMEE